MPEVEENHKEDVGQAFYVVPTILKWMGHEKDFEKFMKMGRSSN